MIEYLKKRKMLSSHEVEKTMKEIDRIDFCPVKDACYNNLYTIVSLTLN